MSDRDLDLDTSEEIILVTQDDEGGSSDKSTQVDGNETQEVIRVSTCICWDCLRGERCDDPECDGECER